ncbi:MAG: peptidyl-prolyl cis-trans isomerase [Desulfamplus sp.]|nr:peptidyl-prolyl cis-trans isomerase [Desulfamplus sp.]MBF0258607.1 peptidyl-prolyl cis-trans isomerase [Desulfamplus sp.]
MNSIIKVALIGIYFCILSNLPVLPAHAGDDSKIFVKGDGFSITQMDLDVENSLLSPDFQTTDDQKINSLLRNRLFALEAKKKWNDPLIDKKIEIMTEKFFGILYGDKIQQSIDIDEDVLKSYYIANPELFMVPNQYNLNMLMVKHKVVCEKIRKDIQSGTKDFITAVQQESLDDETKAKDGSMGWMAEDKLPKEIWNYAASLEKGQISEPFMYDDNWLLIQVADKKKGEKQDFESVKEIIRQKLIEKHYKEKMDAEFERLKKEYHVLN